MFIIIALDRILLTIIFDFALPPFCLIFFFIAAGKADSLFLRFPLFPPHCGLSAVFASFRFNRFFPEGETDGNPMQGSNCAQVHVSAVDARGGKKPGKNVKTFPFKEYALKIRKYVCTLIY